MKNIIPSILLLVFLSGCTTFSLFGGKGKANPIPTKPTRSFEEVEDIKNNVGIVVDVSQDIYTSGTNARSYESEILLKSARVLQTVAGLSTDPVDYKVRKEVEELHGRILESEKEHRIEKAEWEAEIASLQNETEYLKNKNSRLSSSLDSFKFWFWFTVVALGVLTFMCPTIGIPLIKFLVGRAKNLGERAVVETASAFKSQMGQVVDAIEEFKDDPDIDEPAKKKLLEKLQRKTDSHTRKIINEVKNK